MQRLLFLSAFLTCLQLNSQNIPAAFAGARSAALSHATVALTGTWAGHHNQAATALLPEMQAGVSYQNRYFLQDLNLGHATVAYPAAWGTFSLNMTYFGSELYNQSKLGLAFARTFGPYLAFGLQFNYENSAVAEAATLSATTFEASVLASPTKRLQIGFHLYNPNRAYLEEATEQQLPALGRLGLSYKFSERALLVAEARSNLSQSERYAGGFEYQIQELLTLRSGLAFQDDYSATAGLGLNFGSLSADMAYEYGFVLGNNLVYSLQFKF